MNTYYVAINRVDEDMFLAFLRKENIKYEWMAAGAINDVPVKSFCIECSEEVVTYVALTFARAGKILLYDTTPGRHLQIPGI